MVGVLCLFACIMAAVQHAAVGVLGVCTYLGWLLYIVYYFWSRAFAILSHEETGTFDNDPGFATFVIKAIFWLMFISQACTMCMTTLGCCMVAIKGRGAIPMGMGGDDGYNKY